MSSYNLRDRLRAALINAPEIISIAELAHQGADPDTEAKVGFKARVFLHLFTLFSSENPADHESPLLVSDFGKQALTACNSAWCELLSGFAVSTPGEESSHAVFRLAMARAGLLLDLHCVDWTDYAREGPWGVGFQAPRCDGCVGDGGSGGGGGGGGGGGPW
jgi:hypothetical protein